MSRTIWRSAAAAGLLLAMAAPVAAFQAPAETPDSAAEKPLPDGTTAEERSNTARLNAEQAARARADNVTYEQEVSAVQQQVAHDQAVFAEETAAYEAEKARVAAQAEEERLKYEADVAQWKADVAACKAGDRSRCAKPKPAVP
jgi:hypothetical protein